MIYDYASSEELLLPPQTVQSLVYLATLFGVFFAN